MELAALNELFKPWVKALRSDKYEQGIGALYADDNYCCLGVLCDISELGEWIDGHDEDKQAYRLTDTDSNYEVLPAGVSSKYGLMTNGELQHAVRWFEGEWHTEPPGHAYDEVAWNDTQLFGSLTEINDAVGNYGFERIAELIEKFPDWLFHEDMT